jgi:tryptophan synthase beta subunit
MPLILELEQAYAAAKVDPAFQAEMESYLTHYVGARARSTSPTPDRASPGSRPR